MKRIIYKSRAAPSIKADDIAKILAASRVNNKGTGVTGLLVYTRGHFLKVLEGLDHLVDRTYARIKNDKRHTLCELIAEDQIFEPDFGEWLMAFWTDEAETKGNVQGLTSIQNLLKELNSEYLSNKSEFNLYLYDLITGLEYPNAA